MDLTARDQSRVLKVANLIEEGRWGGPQKRICLVAAELNALGLKTTVLLPFAESNHFRQVLGEVGVEWKTLALRRLGRGWRVILGFTISFPAEIFRLRRELKTGNYDLLHVSGGAWQFKGPIAGKLAGIPVIWHLNDTQSAGPIMAAFRYLGHFSEAFVVAANRVRTHYLDGTSLVRIPHYLIPAPVVTDDLSRELVIADEFSLTHSSPRIVSVANINPVKGIETLIKAAAILRSRLDCFSVLIVGPVLSTQTRYFSMLNDLVDELDLRDKVYFVGKRINVASILASTDVYVCSSNTEASPMAVWEAMSMSCAIVSTDVGDVAEYISDGESGFVIPVGNSEAMADRILRLVEDETLRVDFGRRAREVACRDLDIKVIAEETARVYRQVAEKFWSEHVSG